MNKKILILLGIVVVIMLYFYYGGNYMDNNERKNYNQFNKSAINNIILDLDEYARGIRLHFDSGKFIFYPITSPLNENNIFLFTAEKGDRILKKPFQDTLTLEKKDGTILKYTFLKPK